MPKRVLLMISSMRGGGSEQQTLLLLRHLDRAQFEPHLYVTQRAGDLLARIPMMWQSIHSKIRIQAQVYTIRVECCDNSSNT